VTRNLVIFGDSFADPYDDAKIFGWTKLLASEYNYNVKNYAKRRTSLWWSYEKFLKFYNTFKDDCIILFSVTNYGRLSNNNIHIGSFGAVNLEDYPDDFTIANFDRKTTVKILESAKNYFIYLQNENQELFLHKKIIEDVIQKCNERNSRLILIPNYKDIIKFQHVFECSLDEIFVEFLKINGFNHAMIEFELMANHMNETNNKIMAEKINEIIEGSCKKVTIHDFVFEKVPNPEDYWDISKVFNKVN
jgi:hypothetical protein